MEKVWVVGEALIDLVPSSGAPVPIVGGGPANTAKTLANLGIPTSFVGGISSDSYGAMIESEFAESGVDVSLSFRSDLPTALAIVKVNEKGGPTYEFKLELTATFNFSRNWLPKAAPDVLHIGTLAAVIEPGASELFDWASELNAPIVFDPNIRPSVISDKDLYREAVEKWAGISSIIKLSNEDLEWLGYKGVSHFFDLGASLVVVTRGELGIEGFSTSGSISVPGVQVDVVDTVGAGDTVGAVIVEGLLKYGIDGLVGENLSSVLGRAAKAASITCSRAGAKPPTLEELG